MANSLVFILALTNIFLHGVSCEDYCRSTVMAMDNLREVIIGQCTIFQQNVNQPMFCREGFRNCTEIWEAFSEAFIYQPTCNVDDVRFERYINLTDHSIPKDKAMFWENVFPFVMHFSNMGNTYVTLMDTLPGYAGGSPQWCSDPDEPTGMSPPGTTCPGFEATPACPQSAQRAFWVAASRYFGQRAAGEIFIMLNTTNSPIFTNNTYFAVYELPNIRENIVTKATVLLLNEYPVRGKTKCDDPSLDELSIELAEKHIKYACIENRRDVMQMFCLDYPASEMCSMLNEGTSSSSAATYSATVASFLGTVAIMLRQH